MSWGSTAIGLSIANALSAEQPSLAHQQAHAGALLMAGCVLQEQGGGRLKRKGKYRRGSGLYTPGEQSSSSQAQASQNQTSQQGGELPADAAGHVAEPAGGASGAGRETGGEAGGMPEEVARKLGRTDGPSGRPSLNTAAAGVPPIGPCLLSKSGCSCAYQTRTRPCCAVLATSSRAHAPHQRHALSPELEREHHLEHDASSSSSWSNACR